MRSLVVGRSCSVLAVACALAAASMSACARAAQPAPASAIVTWQPLGSWSGRGRIQTESFNSDTGALRVTWKTTRKDGSAGGDFQVTVHSAISGRPLQTAVVQHGAGSGIAYVTDDPRLFYAVVEASNLEWSFTIEEAITYTARTD